MIEFISLGVMPIINKIARSYKRHQLVSIRRNIDLLHAQINNDRRAIYALQKDATILNWEINIYE